MAQLSQFKQGHPKPAFSEKSAKGGARNIFQKIAQKVALVSKAQKHSGANGILL